MNIKAAGAEYALKYAVQRDHGDRAQLIEGVIVPESRPWSHEAAAHSLRTRLSTRAAELGCVIGSGNLDLPGSPNWYVPDLAVVPAAAAKEAGALLPDRTLLIVEVTSESSAETDRQVKRRRYAEYGAPLYLLVDRQQRAVTLFAEPGRLGYTKITGPLPYGGAPLPLPAPFDLTLDTSGL
ncbi:Uma2 family endonuclease [Streptomyces sp. WAC 06783]|uniref:Uma2 family endonuclease n=1 Tax=Streptomyces sp. WAC 06783 TaxID=2203211 RepID=UPI000F73ECA1|nr:Uma2 family endonuclease [Streptomyces sp. WAC 06783]RSO05447.1 Uma2 family endonuclease [Streptomyces sp. WAC 06783]